MKNNVQIIGKYQIKLNEFFMFKLWQYNIETKKVINQRILCVYKHFFIYFCYPNNNLQTFSVFASCMLMKINFTLTFFLISKLNLRKYLIN